MGSGGGLVVSKLSHYSDGHSSNPTKIYNFSEICCWKEAKK